MDARLARLHVPRTEPEALDGVVLALAGLARLWNDPAGRAVVEPLLTGVRWMVLPLTKCPAAAGQGVLAVECRAGDEATLDLLRGLHDPDDGGARGGGGCGSRRQRRGRTGPRWA